MAASASRACFVALVALLIGCEDGSHENGAAAGPGGGAGTGGTGGALPCSEDTNAYPPEAVCVERVRGRIVTETGSGISAVVTSVCGAIACNPGESQDDGHLVVEVGYHIVLSEWSTIAHVRAIDRAPFYFALPLSIGGPDVDVGDLLSLSMPSSGPALVAQVDRMGAPAQTATSNGVTLEVAEGVQVWLSFDDVALGAPGKQFRALRVPDRHLAAFADPALAMVALYALYPFEAAFRPEGRPGQIALARVSFPNDAALPPNGAVEILAHGSFVYPTWVKPASFEVVATGSVTTDGQRIEMDPGEGVPYLTWLGVRPVR